jgi:cell division protein FtsI/penicillin-binding protein 2
MKNPLIALLLLLVVSCTKQNEITTQLEKEFAKTVFQTESMKNDGYSIKTSIDSSIQNIGNQALLASLKQYDADNGFVVIMETNTGKIKSLIGLEKTEGSNYVKSKKVAIDMPIEPGSLIKSFNLMSLMEDKKADTSSVYDAKGGIVSFYGRNIKDNQSGFNKLSLGNAFINNSNTIFAQEYLGWDVVLYWTLAIILTIIIASSVAFYVFGKNILKWISKRKKQ